MKKIETTNIAGLVKAPFIKATHDHYVASIKETTAQNVLSQIGSYTTNDLVILYGCDVTVTGGAIPGTGTAELTAGAIYYNGEIYEVDEDLTLSTTNPETLYWEVVTTYAAGDPIQWSDGSSRNLHQINKLRLVAGTSGGGLADYDGSTVKYLNFQATSNSSVSSFSTSNCSLTIAQYNAIKKGNLITMSLRVVMVVTTGASASSVILNTIPNLNFIASTPMTGTFQVRNTTAGSHISESLITNALNTIDVSIDANSRVKINLTGGSVGNGETATWIIQFTAYSEF